ncbi:MAG: isocitrate/isopropylmalate family dehydrogenase [Pseudomonadota bacterium]
MKNNVEIAVIRGDGIGVDVTDATLAVIETALGRAGLPMPHLRDITAGAGYYEETGLEIEEGGYEAAGAADAILLGSIGLPWVRKPDGTEIAPHLKLRDMFGLYGGVRPVRAYPNAPQRLADPRAAGIDLVILRESTEGLFYSAAVHGRAEIIGDEEVRDTLRITRSVTERLHHFAFRLAERRKVRGKKGLVTCVDKSNVFESMAFFRKIFDEVRGDYPGIEAGYSYVDAQALDLIRRPWDFDVLVMENMFGDILSDLAGGLVGGMGMAACGEYGDAHALFQPAHGTAPDIMGQDKANPLAAILSGAMMLDYLADRTGASAYADAAGFVEEAVGEGFRRNDLRPMEFGGDMGTKAVTDTVIALTREAQPA